MLLDDLHQVGTVFHRPDLFGDRVIVEILALIAHMITLRSRNDIDRQLPE